MLATQTTRRCWSHTSESLVEVWPKGSSPSIWPADLRNPALCLQPSFLPASLQRRKTALAHRKSDDPGEPWRRAGAGWPWPLQNHQWWCVTWSPCVLSSFSPTQLVIVRSSGSSPPALPPLWGASATSAVQTEMRPSNSFPRRREETTAFPPFIPHAPPLFSAVVCEPAFPLCASLFFPFFSLSVARGGALGYFLINKGSIVLSRSTREEYPQMYYTVHYGEYGLFKTAVNHLWLTGTSVN